MVKSSNQDNLTMTIALWWGAQYELFTMSAEGRVENQKLNQTAALLSLGWVFGIQLDTLEKNLTTLGFTFSMMMVDIVDRW